MDDRTGIWVIMTGLKKIAQGNPFAKVVAVSSAQEEIGLRGATTSAYNVNPDIAIAVDVTHATDCPGIDQNEFGRIEIGKGAVVVRGPNANPRVVDLLIQQAQEKSIPFQLDVVMTPIPCGGCAMGLVTIPNRYMHSPVELVAESDLENASDLIAAFCLAINQDSQFIP